MRGLKWKFFFAVVFLGVLLANLAHSRTLAPQTPPHSPPDRSCVEKNSRQILELDLPKTDLTFPYHVNRNCPSDEVTNLIVVVHGTSRTGKGYFNNVRALLGEGDLSTVIVAPQFLLCANDASPCDSGVGNPDHPKRVYWDHNDKWKTGGKWARKLNRTGHGKTRSSFKVMDHLIRSMQKKYPNIKNITVAGHSAGGQFVQRYAASSPYENILFDEGREVRFVVANPSSYLYFHPFRRIRKKWLLPFFPTCPNFNHYRFGIEFLNPAEEGYLIRTGPHNMTSWYPERRVTYLLGEKDNRQNGNMDASCGAMLQGKHRLARGKIYHRYMNDFFERHNHDLVIVPDARHSSKEMFQSNEGRRVMLWWEY